MQDCEILAPAGGEEQLSAAVRSGADAVYLGTKNFNARRNADNFESKTLGEIVSFCHVRGVKVHVTVNTIVFDNEKEKLINTIKEIADSGADAVIVQDLFVAEIIRECCPSLPMHASTQLTVHNLSGAKLMERLGFKRVVLSRELSFKEIKMISEKSHLETEVFIHGALCMSMSGMCYLSSALGERSGNRGLCAQPCRLNFNLKGKEYALSLKDMSHIDYINKLREAGVCSFKIEGRMKRPEYVAATVTACRNALQGEAYDVDMLRNVFSRSGFTDGYISGKRTSDMFGYRTKENVQESAAALRGASALYKKELQKIPVDMIFSVSDKASLIVSDSEYTVSSKSDNVQNALSHPTQRDTALKLLSKTGDTPYYLNSLEFSNSGELMLAASEINKMRRDALSLLSEKRGAVSPHIFTDKISEKILPEKKRDAQYQLRVRIQSAAQYSQFSGSEKIIVPMEELLLHKEIISERTVCELPALIFPEDEQSVSEKLKKLKTQGITEGYAENAGGINLLFENGYKIYGGSALNCVNSESLFEYQRLGVSDMTLSTEISMDKVKHLKTNLNIGIIGYGFLPLMRMRACPAKGKSGCGDCSGINKLTDRKNKSFTLACSGRKYTTLSNSVPLYIADKEIDNVNFVTLYFSFESRAECEKIYREFSLRSPCNFERTTGLYYRTIL